MRTQSEEISDEHCGLQNVLEIVEDEQNVLLLYEGVYLLKEGSVGLLAESKCLGNYSRNT